MCSFERVRAHALLALNTNAAALIATQPNRTTRNAPRTQKPPPPQNTKKGFFHGDPHPGNLLKVTEGPDAGKLALLDFGLVAEIPAQVVCCVCD